MIMPEEVPGSGASDAKATSDYACIGGWWSDHDPPAMTEAVWFSERVERARFPWVFDRVSPQRRIGALEMLGSVILLRLVVRNYANSHLNLSVPMSTDSQCNSFAALKLYSRRMPTAAVHMELLRTAAVHNVFPRLSHVKRDFNVWADALTEERFLDFHPDQRWRPSFGKAFFYVLDEMAADYGDKVV